MLTSPNYAAEIERLNSRISELEEENANLRLLDEAITRNTAMFEALIAHSSDGIALMGPDRRIVRVVRAAMGFIAGEVAGVPIESLIHPDDRDILVDCYDRLLKGSSKTEEFEGRVCRPDGSIGWVSAQFTDLLDDPNVQAIVCNYTDVTEWKQRDLIMAEFASIVESSDRAIFSKDPAGRILTWNPGAQKLYGYPAEEISGRHIRTLVPVEMQDEERFTRRLVGENSQPVEFRTIRICRCGSRIPVQVQLAPVLDRYGRTRGISDSSRRDG